MLRLIGLSLVSCLSSSALAQDARMPDDCVAIAKQIQTETHVRFRVHYAIHQQRSSLRSCQTAKSGGDFDNDAMSSLGVRPGPIALLIRGHYLVGGIGSVKGVLRSRGSDGHRPYAGEAGILNEASRRCFRKALKSGHSSSQGS